MLHRLVRPLGAVRSGRARLIFGAALAVLVTVYALLTSSHTLPEVVSTRTPIATAPGLTAQQQTALALHVAGNHLVTRDGHSMVLRGVTRDASDFFCAEGKGIFDGPTGPASITALRSWHINAVRIPLNESCWLGTPGIAGQYSGAAYQDAIAAYTQALTDSGVYVILDLHKVAPGTDINTHSLLPMPDADHAVTFWQQVASRFQGNGMVLFELYNEPNFVDWPCLRDGGNCEGVPYTTVGMQTLVQTVRATGATNVVLIGGTFWANDLSQWLDYAPSDPLHNLAASWHVYMLGGDACNTIECYAQTVAPVAAQVPVVATEFGTDPKGAACDQALTDGIAVLLSWLDQYGAGYLAFSWNVGGQTCGSLSLISDYAGTPHAPNGTLFRAHLLALAA